MSEPYLGQIIYFAGNFAIRGYAICQGQQLSIAQNTALFSILGTTYGGNGQTTFALPDLRSRVPVGAGQGPGLSNYVLGQQSGQEQVTLNTANLPPHNHPFTSTSSLNANGVKGTTNLPTAGYQFARAIDGDNDPNALPFIYAPADTANQVALGGLNVAGTVGVTGSGVPFNNLQPTLGLNPEIATQGIFPSRN